MKLIIVSPRIGTPGEPFDPAPGTNVDALIENGLVSVHKESKKSKVTEQSDKE